MAEVAQNRGRLRLNVARGDIPLPTSNALESRPLFIVSNEPRMPGFKRGVSVFAEISRDIDGYVGVTGGGSQNLMLLSALLRDNNETLKIIDLVDIRPEQQQNFAIMANENNKATGKTFEHRIVVDGVEIPENPRYSAGRYFTIPVAHFDSDVDVNLRLVGMYEYLKGPIPSGRYALYFSNIPLWVNGEGHPESQGVKGFEKMLNYIAESDKFKVGTTILVNRVTYIPMVMQKTDEGIVLLHKESLWQYPKDAMRTALSFLVKARSLRELKEAVGDAWHELKMVPEFLRRWKYAMNYDPDEQK